MDSKVSVIIPTYNRSKIIVQAIKSVLNQIYQNFEIVVIDDSSDNETEKTIKSLNDERIKYIRNKIKTNLPTARNQGVKESSPDSKYIAFLDDDDEWLPQFLEKTVEKIEENSEVAMIYTLMELRTKDNKKIGETKYNRKNKYWEQIIGTGCLIRKDIFTKENFWYDERKVIDDLDFGLRVLKNHKWDCVPEVLMIYYPYPPSNETSASSALPLKEIELFGEKHQGTYIALGREALGFFHFKVGREFLKTGEIKKGEKEPVKSFFDISASQTFFILFNEFILSRIFSENSS